MMNKCALWELRMGDRIKPISGTRELTGFADVEGKRTAVVTRIDNDAAYSRIRYALEDGEIRDIVFPTEAQIQVQVLWGPYAIHYRYFDRYNSLHNAVKEFNTEGARRRWVERQEQADRWHSVVAYADPE